MSGDNIFIVRNTLNSFENYLKKKKYIDVETRELTLIGVSVFQVHFTDCIIACDLFKILNIFVKNKYFNLL